MKTIKLILNADGSVNSLTYGFQLNQYSYADTLINIYVPTEIVDLNITQLDGATYSTNVIMSVNYLQANGTYKLGNPYYFTYVKTNVIIDNVNYTLFERTMPREFTLNYGLQKFGASVVSIKTTTENGVTTNEVIGVITTSNFELNINQASNMVDNPIETDTDLSTLIANVNALLSNILLKQDKNDNLIQVSLVNGGLTTTDSVVIALNSLNDRVNQNFNNIGDNDSDIADIKQDIIDINNKIITGFRYCGSITSVLAPNSTLLDNFMSIQGLTKQNGDIVNWVREIEDATDERYRCEYGVNGWSIIEMPEIETASNGDAGLVMGNYNIGDTTSDILANIIGGKITEIYYKNNGVYYNLSTDLSNAITEIANIINGTTTVGKSQYATYDSTEFGSATPKTINDKFLSKDLGATKQFVKDYALPKQFGDVYFLNTVNQLFETNLNPSSTNIQTTLSSVGYGTILDVYLDNDVNASYQLSNKNSISLSTYIALSTTTSINFRLDVTYKKGGTNTPICNLITSTYSFTANTYKKIDFTSYLTLISNELNVENGQYEIKITANMATSTPITFTIYSTSSLPTSFNLNLYSTSLIIGSGYLGEINYHELTGVRNGSYCNYDMPSDTDLLDNTEHRFSLTIPLDAVDSDIVRIRKGTTNIPIFSNKTNTMYYYFLKSYISYSGKASLVATYYNGAFYLNDEIELDKISYVVVDSLSGTITNYRYFMNAYDYDYLGIICRDSNSGENVKYVVSDNGSGNLYSLKSTQIFTDANGDFYYTGTINRSSGVYSLGNKVYLSSGGGIAQTMIETTYADLVTAISNNELVAGCWYRITDYVTKVKGVYDLTAMLGQTAYLPYAKSAEHPFDLLVLATSENTLNENAKAMLHNGDTYFASQNLGAWEIKYTVENDDTKYSWVDSTNGKGTIYYMKDEYNNSCYYDFKNIQTLCFGLKCNETMFIDYTFNGDMANLRHCRYGSLSDVFDALSGASSTFYELSAKELAGTSMIKTIVLLSRTDDTYLSQLYDWDTLCAVLSSMAGETIDINALSYVWGISVADLQAMTNLDFIHTILEGDFYYTFDTIDTTDSIFTHYDLSLVGGNCHDNAIGHTADALTTLNAESGIIPHGLSCNVFQTNQDTNLVNSNSFGANCFLNIFGVVYDNSIGDAFIGNEFSSDNSFNKGYTCGFNKFGNRNLFGLFGNAYYNLIGNNNRTLILGISKYNSISNGNSETILFVAEGNVIGNVNRRLDIRIAEDNVIGNDNEDITLYDEVNGNITDANIIGNSNNRLTLASVGNSVFGNDNYDIIVNYGFYNTFGNGNSNIHFDGVNYIELTNCVIENYVRDLTITVTGSIAMNNVRICSRITNKSFTITGTNNYQIVVKDTNSTDVNV